MRMGKYVRVLMMMMVLMRSLMNCGWWVGSVFVVIGIGFCEVSDLVRVSMNRIGMN